MEVIRSFAIVWWATYAVLWFVRYLCASYMYGGQVVSVVRVRFAGANANIDLRVAAAAGPVAGSRQLRQAPPLALRRRRFPLLHTYTTTTTQCYVWWVKCFEDTSLLLRVMCCTTVFNRYFWEIRDRDCFMNKFFQSLDFEPTVVFPERHLYFDVWSGVSVDSYFKSGRAGALISHGCFWKVTCIVNYFIRYSHVFAINLRVFNKFKSVVLCKVCLS